MEDYKKFIQEIQSLRISVVELMTEPKETTATYDGLTLPSRYTEIYPLSYLSPRQFSEDELLALRQRNGMRVQKYWDLSHYGTHLEINFAEAYSSQLYTMLTNALIDLTENAEKMKLQLNLIEQWLQRFRDFAKKFATDNMFQYFNNDPFYLNTAYYQDDLKHNYLCYFVTSGIEQKYNGYGPEFIKHLYHIYMTKRGALESLKTHITAVTGGELKRKKLPPEETVFSGDEAVSQMVKAVIDAGNETYVFEKEKGWVVKRIENKKNKNAPTREVLALFCNIVNEAGLSPKETTEDVEQYCRRICSQYNYTYTDKVRQLFSKAKSKKNLQKIRDLILPKINKTDSEVLAKYLTA